MELIIIALIIIIVYALVKVIKQKVLQNKIAKHSERERTEEKVNAIKKRLSGITEKDIAKMSPSERNRLQTDIYNHISEMMCEDFKKIGWTHWNPEIHAMPEQLDRIKRASGSTNGISLRHYSPNTTTGIIKGSSGKIYLTCGHGCSCPDFRKRGLPCKHMYYLAMSHDDYKNVVTGYGFIPYNAEDNTLYGLNFCILGRNQAAVKEYILKHAGTFGQNSWWNISAVVVHGETHSQKLLSAQENGVIVMTFDDLKSLCEDIGKTNSVQLMEEL